MKIIEVRDGFIKFESNEKLEVSSFIQVEDRGRIFVAQVLQTRFAGDRTVAYAKFLFIYDGTFVPNRNVCFSTEAKISVLLPIVSVIIHLVNLNPGHILAINVTSPSTV